MTLLHDDGQPYTRNELDAMRAKDARDREAQFFREVQSCVHTIAVLVHADTPPSLNRMGTRGSHWATSRAKKQWQQNLGMLLLVNRIPRNLQHVTASAVLRFPTRRRRDEDNHSWLLAKALGDALVNGWLPDDTPEHFRFAGLTFDPEPGPRRTTITLRLR
jgi:hypothetical protein